MNLKSRIFKHFVGTTGPSAEKSAQSSPSGNRSAPWAQNSANSIATAKELVDQLGDDVDLLDLGSVNEPESERLQQLKAVGEKWSNSRVEVKGEEWSW